MCIDAKTSISAWLICIIIAVYLWHRNQNYDRWNALFIATFTLIQLLEAGIWSGYNNQLLTEIILVALLLQPMVQTFASYYYTESIFMKYLIIVYAIILVYTIYRVITAQQGQFYSDRGPNGHMVWHDTRYPNSFLAGGYSFIGVLYLIGLFVPLLFMKDYKWVPLIIVGLGTLFYSLYMTRNQEFSSVWCLSATLYALVAIFI